MAGLVVVTVDAVLVGFAVPGETVALLAGAAVGHLSLAGVLVVAVVVWRVRRRRTALGLRERRSTSYFKRLRAITMRCTWLVPS